MSASVLARTISKLKTAVSTTKFDAPTTENLRNLANVPDLEVYLVLIFTLSVLK